MIRRRYSYDLECEKKNSTQRDTINNLLHMLRPYYYDYAWRSDHIADALFSGKAERHYKNYETDI